MTESAPIPTADAGNGDGSLNYFAIGAMMHPTSIRLRNIHPISSEPAELLDYRIGFFTNMGYAEAVPEAGSSLHGVIHRVTSKDMAALDTIEILYKRHVATARLYNGDTCHVTVYTRDDEHVGRPDDAPPGERYLDIMVAGANYHGVESDYVDFLKQHERVPRTPPSKYQSLGKVAEEMESVTLDQIEKHNGLGGKPLWIALNGKVMEGAYDECDSPAFQRFCAIFQKQGQIAELVMSKLLYDPKYGIPERLQDVVPEHAAYLEDDLCKFLSKSGFLKYWKVVGKFEAPVCSHSLVE